VDLWEQKAMPVISNYNEFRLATVRAVKAAHDISLGTPRSKKCKVYELLHQEWYLIIWEIIKVWGYASRYSIRHDGRNGFDALLDLLPETMGLGGTRPIVDWLPDKMVKPLTSALFVFVESKLLILPFSRVVSTIWQRIYHITTQCPNSMARRERGGFRPRLQETHEANTAHYGHRCRVCLR
jgi:hypothetical protein